MIKWNFGIQNIAKKRNVIKSGILSNLFTSLYFYLKYYGSMNVTTDVYLS